MIRFRPKIQGIPEQGGTTLIEVMIASFILSLTFFAVVAMIRKAQDIGYEANSNFQARRIANSILEKSRYHHTHYDDIPADSIYPAHDRPVIFDDSGFVSIGLLVTSRSQPGSDASDLEYWNGTTIPYKRIEAIVTWGSSSQLNTVSASKRIAKLK